MQYENKAAADGRKSAIRGIIVLRRGPISRRIKCSVDFFYRDYLIFFYCMLKKIRTETKEIICLGSIIFDTYWIASLSLDLEFETATYWCQLERHDLNHSNTQ